MAQMTLRGALWRGSQAVLALMGAFGGFLANIAPPQGDSGVSVSGFVKIVLLLIFFLVSLLAESFLRNGLRVLWITSAVILTLASVGTFFWYQEPFESRTILFPPDGENRIRVVIGEDKREDAIEYLKREEQEGRYLSDSLLLDDYGGMPNIGDIWTPESIRESRRMLTLRYLVFSSLLASAGFSFVEIFRLGKEEPSDLPDQGDNDGDE